MKKFKNILILSLLSCILFSSLVSTTNAADTFDPVWPTDGGYTISCLYYYKDGSIHGSSWANGVGAFDISVATESEVYAIEDGTVSFAGWDSSGYGYSIKVLHSNGETSRYSHLSKIDVNVNERVSRGKKIGLSGNTGDSQGPHLDFGYSGGDLFREVFIGKYYQSISFQKNCYLNNTEKDSDASAWLIDLIANCYSKNWDYYYFNPQSNISPYISCHKTVPLYQLATVTAKSGLNIREAPSGSAKVVGCLGTGEAVKVVGMAISDSNGVYWKKLLDNRGWVCQDYLHLSQNNYYLSGTFLIRSQLNGKYLTVQSSAIKSGTDVIMFSEKEEYKKLQLWTFEPLGYYPDGSIAYRIYPYLNPDYSLDADSSTSQVHIWEKLGNDHPHVCNQYWNIIVCSNGTIELISEASRLALDIKDASNDDFSPLITYEIHHGKNQRWTVEEP